MWMHAIDRHSQWDDTEQKSKAKGQCILLVIHHSPHSTVSTARLWDHPLILMSLPSLIPRCLQKISVTLIIHLCEYLIIWKPKCKQQLRELNDLQSELTKGSWTSGNLLFPMSNNEPCSLFIASLTASVLHLTLHYVILWWQLLKKTHQTNRVHVL